MHFEAERKPETNKTVDDACVLFFRFLFSFSISQLMVINGFKTILFKIEYYLKVRLLDVPSALVDRFLLFSAYLQFQTN